MPRYATAGRVKGRPRMRSREGDLGRCGGGEVSAGGCESAGAVYEGYAGEDAGMVGGEGSGGGVSGAGEEEDAVWYGGYCAGADCGCFDVRVMGCR